MGGGREGVRAGIVASRFLDCGGGGRGSGNIRWTWPSRVYATVGSSVDLGVAACLEVVVGGVAVEIVVDREDGRGVGAEHEG